jgi:hypothetical protein
MEIYDGLNRRVEYVYPLENIESFMVSFDEGNNAK